MPKAENPPAVQVKQLLNSPAVAAAIMRAKPKHVSVDEITSAALTAVSDNPALTKNPNGLLRVVVQASQLGLKLGSTLGEAYPVPFKDSVTLIIGYQGMMQLCRNSGEISSIEARIVYERDEFEVFYGTESRIHHKPFIGDAGEMVAVCSVVTFKDKDTRPLVDFMTKTQVDRIRDRSRSGNSGPWVTDYDEMARKTVTKRNLKYAPRSAELKMAMHLDSAAEAGETATIGKEDVIDLGAAAEVSQADALEAELAGEVPDAS